ncbi:hypothetical protein, partial [Moorena bouillonii]|uniref:hypothetical protein n=1 Tax=Moorena bouillonii TaxID=207920 RepID=UPI003F6A3EFD
IDLSRLTLYNKSTPGFDIKDWLIKFRGLSKSESKQLAQQIYRESEGTPHTICSILEDKFK